MHLIMPRIESALQYIKALAGRNGNKDVTKYTKLSYCCFFSDVTIATTPAQLEWWQNPGRFTGNHSLVNCLGDIFFLCIATRVMLWTPSAATVKLELLDLVTASIIDLTVDARPKIASEPTSNFACGPGLDWVSDAAAAPLDYTEAGAERAPQRADFWLYEPNQTLKATWTPDTAVLGAASVTAAMKARMMIYGWKAETPSAA